RVRSPSPLFLIAPTATTDVSPLSLHDALPIWDRRIIAPADLREHFAAVTVDVDRVLAKRIIGRRGDRVNAVRGLRKKDRITRDRSEEHTSELQSRENLVCRLLLEKKKKAPDRP